MNPQPAASKSPAAKFQGGAMAVWCDDAVTHPAFPRHAALTYLALCRYAGSKDSGHPGTARVSQQRLADCFGEPPRTVRQHLKDLCDAGFVYATRTGRSNIYVIAGDRSKGRVAIGADMSPEAVAAREEQAQDLARSILGAAIYRREDQRTAIPILAKVATRLLALGHGGDDIEEVIVEILNDQDAQIPSVARCLTELKARP